MLDPYRTQTFALRRRLVNSNGPDRARLVGSYLQVRLKQQATAWSFTRGTR